MKISLMILFYIFILQGCGSTSFQSYDTRKNSNKQMGSSKAVKYKISDHFYRAPPQCIIILPTKGVGSSVIKQQIGITASRHLSGYVNRVIGILERQSIEHNLVLDATNINDRKLLSRKTKCKYYLQVTAELYNDTYAVIWAQKSIGLKLTLHGIDDTTILWTAYHQANRGDGGIPLSLISFGMAVFNAGKTASDKEILPSILDDVFRRIYRTLPDTRIY